MHKTKTDDYKIYIKHEQKYQINSFNLVKLLVFTHGGQRPSEPTLTHYMLKIWRESNCGTRKIINDLVSQNCPSPLHPKEIKTKCQKGPSQY